MEPGTSPRNVTSKRSIKYKNSKWSVHEFEVWSGQLVCRILVLRMEESLLVWVGGAGEAQLGAVALALPGGGSRRALSAHSTALLRGGAPSEVEALAARVAATLARPVYVCLALPLDRFTAPLVERGLVAEMRLHPHFFYSPPSLIKDDPVVCAPMTDNQQIGNLELGSNNVVRDCVNSESNTLETSNSNDYISVATNK